MMRVPTFLEETRLGKPDRIDLYPVARQFSKDQLQTIWNQQANAAVNQNNFTTIRKDLRKLKAFCAC